jgi:hypothetical protein
VFRERIVVVANSRKTGGRCVAGVSLHDHRLVRPVSPHGNGSLSDEQCGVGGRTPRLLEVVSFAHHGPANDPAQPENLVIDGSRWTFEGPAKRSHALELLTKVLDRKTALFVNRGRAVPEERAAEGLETSLALIEPRNLRFGHGPQAGAHEGSPRALFTHRGHHWSLPLTDFELGPRILGMPEGIHRWGDLGLTEPARALLTVSLGSPHEGWRHKLVAAVLRFR